MAYDGSLKFDTAIDQSGFKLGISGLGSIAQAGMTIVTKALSSAADALSSLGKYAVSVGSSFESSMSNVIATMGITSDTIENGVNSYDLLKQAAEDAGASTTFSASEAADALNYLALAGYDAQQAAEALPAVLDLAAAGGMALADASDLVTDAMAALGIEATTDNLTHFGDELAKTASKSNTSVSQLGEAILTVGGTAKSLAGGTTELNSALGVLANRGIKGSEGGTALRNVILSLTAPTDTAAAAMESLGLTVLDAEGNMRPINEIFQDLDSSLSSMSEGEKTAVLNKIFNKTDLAAVTGLLDGCGTEFDELTAALEDCDGAMSQMADTMTDNLEGDLKSVQSKAEAFGVALYDQINAPLRELVQLGGSYITELTEAFGSGGFEELAESVGTVLSDIATRAADMLTDITEIGASIAESLAEGLLSNVDSIAESASEIATTLISGLISIVPLIIDTAVTFITVFAENMINNAPDIINAAVSMVSALVSGLVSMLPTIIQAAIKIILLIADTIVANLDSIISASIALIQTLCTELLTADNVSKLMQAAYDILMAVVNAIIDNLDELIDTAFQIIRFFCTELLTVDNISKVIDAAYQILMAIVDAIIDNLDEFVDTAIELITYLCTELLTADNIKKLSDASIKIVMKLAKAIVDNLDDILLAANSLIESLLDELLTPENIANIISTGVGILAQLISGLGQVAGKLAGFAWELFTELATALSEINWGELGISIVEGILSGLLDIDFSLSDYFSDFKDNFLTGIKDIFGIHSPSKLMAKFVGKPIAQGIGEGFTEEIPDVGEDAAESMKQLGFINPEVKIDTSAIELFELLARNTGNYTADDTGAYMNSVVNNSDYNSSENTTIYEESNYHIYTQARNSADARELAEELESIKTQDRKGKGM